MKQALGAAVAAMFVFAAAPAHAVPPLPGSSASAKSADKIMGAWPIDYSWAADKEKAYALANGAKAAALFLKACREQDVRGCVALLTEGQLEKWVAPADRTSAFGRANALYAELCAAEDQFEDEAFCGDWHDLLDELAEASAGDSPDTKLNLAAGYAPLAAVYAGQCLKVTKLQSIEAYACQHALDLGKEYNPSVLPKVTAHVCSLGYPCKKAAAPKS